MERQVKERVELFGNQYEVGVGRLSGWPIYMVSGSIEGEWLQIERYGRNAALAGWRAAAQQKLKV